MTINKSKTYLLPLLSEFVKFKRKFFKGITNTYILDEREKYKNCIFIEHKLRLDSPKFTKQEYQFTDNELFVDLIDGEDHVTYIFKFPTEYLPEYVLFQEGKYSMYKKDAKVLILKFFTYIYKDNLSAISFLLRTKHVLFRSKRLKTKIENELVVDLSEKAELLSIPNLKDEKTNLQQDDTKSKKEINNLFGSTVGNI